MNREDQFKSLIVGVDFEEAGEKWRAGDAQKAARFFSRALDKYSQGLDRFPNSFDLAYNKARLQYELSQQPRLLPHLQRNEMSLLNSAVASHRDALSIRRDSPDLLLYVRKVSIQDRKAVWLITVELSNTGQVLTSLAELISEDRNGPCPPGSDPLDLFREALDSFQRCATLQRQQITEQGTKAHALAQEPMDLDHQATESTAKTASEPVPSVSEASDQDMWVSIAEVATEHALADTYLAQFGALTSLCSLLSVRGSGDLKWIDDCYLGMLYDLIPFNREQFQEHILARVRYMSAFVDAGFGLAKFDILRYESLLTDAQVLLKEQYSDEPQALCDMADAELTFNASVERLSYRVKNSTLDDRNKSNVIRWKHLTKALDYLTAASKLPTAKNLPRIHLRRGDCEMLRRRLGAAPWNYDLANRSASTLLKNAEIYYRGAARLAKAETDVDEEEEASVKEAVAAALAGDLRRLQERVYAEIKTVREVLDEAVDDGVIAEADIEKLSI
ncbi:MAG: hypothetical protein Q9212_000189 [Teloschistes hypoglaucus]